MLDNITKKNIDDCRDVLVGKVPDPKSQIEQITLALIYKFMDDMDKEAVEKFGGKAKFFTGEYERYGWRKLFDPSLSGADMLVLYSEALEKLNTNPNIPELFRNIFKNAYLPYRDPGTLKLFLKYINEFEYSHSEKLGDAFEYLLSVMGSQGDAGQFRTPRHIIDFVTACVNPQKNETVLDPACGTAGFLLSAYKHILNEHTDKRQGDKLKPEDRKKLATNFVGYDISPDMVRLSLANMYLHGFATPNILEYDTLSSEDRWNETYDVILANPPFMTPKGGIRPHKKFGVQANKAEVLFTDYIAEHLNPNGRAGIVVPNGIVATSQTAYKELRKHLITDSLIAVISLPAGCFNPYSGVKTSVLILDKRLAKKSKHVLFLKIENDGFDLGAQRREHDKNDLPEALRILHAYKDRLKEGIEEDGLAGIVNEGFKLATLVEKGIILANKDVVLSADRYFISEAKLTTFEIVKLEDVCNIQSGGTPSKTENLYWENGTIPWVGSTVCKNESIYSSETFITELGLKKSSTKMFPKGTTLIALVGATIGKTAYLEFETTTNQNIAGLQTKDETILNKKYLFLISQTLYDQFYALGDGGFRMASLAFIKTLEIPLPPIEIQEQIVAEIEGYQKVIDGAKMVVNNYKPTISVKPEWEVVELGEVAGLSGGGTPSKEISEYWENGNIDWITCSDFSDNEMYIKDSIRKITEKGLQKSSATLIKSGTLVLVTRVSLGKMAFVQKPTAINQDLTAIHFDSDSINKFFVYFYLKSISHIIESNGHGATVKGVTRDYVRTLSIPLPLLSEQEVIVKAIEEEMEIVEANKRLIEIFEEKVRKKIGEVWGSN